jgi:DNA-binding XRE family transcriptional regulator
MNTAVKVHHNVKVAANRGKKWLKNLRASRLDVQMNPTEVRLGRLKKNLIQADLAEKLGVSLSTYTAIERGKRHLREEDARTVSKILSASFSSLFTEDDRGRYQARLSHQKK